MQLVGTSSDQVKQSIDLQLAKVWMAGASGWFMSKPLSGWWVVMQGSYGRFWPVA